MSGIRASSYHITVMNIYSSCRAPFISAFAIRRRYINFLTVILIYPYIIESRTHISMHAPYNMQVMHVQIITRMALKNFCKAYRKSPEQDTKTTRQPQYNLTPRHPDNQTPKQPDTQTTMYQDNLTPVLRISLTNKLQIT